MLGFEVDDTELKKFDSSIESAKAKFNAFVSSLKTSPAVDDSSVRQLGETVDSVQAKTESLGSEAIIAPAVDDSSVRQLGEAIADTAAKADALSSETIGPQVDGGTVRGLGDELDRTKAKADELDGKKIKPETDAKPVEKLGKAVDETKNKTESLMSAFLKANLIMSAVSKVMGAAFGFIRDSIIGTTAETERFRVALGTMMGDQERANKIIRDLDYGEGMFEGVRLSDFYGTANAIGGLQNMVTFGMQAEEAGDVLARLGDIAQGDSEAFVSMSNAMGQVFARGKADSVRLKQFAAKGFDVVGEVAKQTGKSRDEIEKAGVTYEQTAAALRALTNEGGKYHGMLAKQMNTLGGILKQYASFKAATAEAIGFGISDQLKEFLKYILAIGRAGQDSFVNVFVKGIKEVIHWIWQIIIMWEVLGFRIADMGDALAPVKQFFLALRDAADDVLTGIMILAVEVGKLFVAAFKPIQAFASPIIRELGAIAKDVLTAIAGFIRPLIPMVEGSAGFFGVLGQAIAGLLRPALKVALAVKGITLALGAYKTARGIADTFGLLTGKMSVMKKAAEGNRVAMMMLDAQMLKSKISAMAQAAATKIAAVATKAWAGIQAIFNAIMAANPIALIVIGVMALIAAIVLLVKNWDKVKNAFANAGKAIGNFFSGAGEKIKSFAGPIVEKVGGAFNSLKDKAVEGAQKMVAAFAERFPNLYQFIVDLISKIKEIFGKLADIIRPPIEALLNVIKTGFSFVIGIFKAIGLSLFNVIKTIFTSIWNIIKTIFTSVWEVIKSVFDAVRNTVMAVFNVFKTIFFSIFNVIKGVFLTILNTVLSVFDGVIGIWRGGGDIFSKIWESVKLVFSSVFNAILDIATIIGNAFIAVWESVKNVFVTIWEGVSGVFKSVWEGIVNVFSAYVDGIKNIIASVAEAFLSVWEQVKRGVATMAKAVLGLWKSLVNAIKTILGGLKNWLASLWRSIVNIAKSIWETLKSWFISFIEAVKTIWGAITGFFSGLWDGIVNTAMAVWDTLKDWFSGLVEGIKNIWSAITGFFSGLWEAVKEGPAAAIEYIKDAFFGLFNSIQEKLFGFINKIREGWETVKSFFGGVGEGVVNFFTGGGQTQPAYAGSASQAAMAGAVGQTSNYAYTTMGGGSSTVNAQTTFNMNVPAGTPAEQSESLARQLDAQFDAKLASLINGSRADIPSPEVRRR